MDRLQSPGRRQFLGTIFSASLLWATTGLLPELVFGQSEGKAKSNNVKQQIDFIHVADMHAAYNPDTLGSSPMARIRGYLEEARRANPFTLFTNSGDDYEKGSLAEQLSRGETTRQVVHSLGYDVRTLGNHDFAWGLEELLRFSDDDRTAVLCANARLRASKTDTGNLAKGPVDFVVRQVGRLKIGFFGLTTRPYGSDSHQHDGPVYPEHPELAMNFDHLSIARDIIARHRHQVDLLVLVSHLGITDDQTLANKIEGIDLILGGHSHTVLNEPVRVRNTTIVHVGSNGERFGHLQLEFDLVRKSILSSSFRLIDNRLLAESPDAPPPTVDPGAARAIASILAPYHRELHEVIGTVREQQTRADMAQIAARAATATLGVDATFIEPQAIWREWQPGPLSRQDILDAFQVEREPVNTPGTTSLYLVRLSGAELRRARQNLADCIYDGPTLVDPQKTYCLAVPKNRLFNHPDLFPLSRLSSPQAAAELWEVVSGYAREQWRHSLALDQSRTEHREIVALSSPGAEQQRTL